MNEHIIALWYRRDPHGLGIRISTNFVVYVSNSNSLLQKSLYEIYLVKLILSCLAIFLDK